jgi:hypothetical protein
MKHYENVEFLYLSYDHTYSKSQLGQAIGLALIFYANFPPKYLIKECFAS